MRTSLPAGLALACLIACSPTPPSSVAPTSLDTAGIDIASLLRRIAEAVDGYRDGIPRFVVAHRMPPHHVAGVFTSAESATDTLAHLPAGYDVFGPFRATENPPQVVEASEAVDSVIVWTHDGERKTYLGNKVDALFWSLPAFDKFIVPYLNAVHGPRYAAAQREAYRLNLSSLAGSQTVPHYRSSF